jgi:hypothetical protein
MVYTLPLAYRQQQQVLLERALLYIHIRGRIDARIPG